MKPLLSLSLSVEYPNKHRVLDNCEIDVAPGEITGLIGQSGSGKSTLAMAALGLLDTRRVRVEGRLLFDGIDLLRCGERELRSLRGLKIGLVFQSAASSLNPNLRIGTQIREAWKVHGHGNWETETSRVLSLLGSLDLHCDESFLRRYPGEISVGQAQRVLIAMSVIHHPSLLIADEPTSALDPIARADVLRLFKRLNEQMNMALLYISHDFAGVAALCRKLSILYQGRIVESGECLDVLRNPQHAYTRALVGAISAVPFSDAAECATPNLPDLRNACESQCSGA